MLSLEDCIAFSGLTRDEIDAIAEHEHVPEIVAAELGNYLLRDAAGGPKIRRMIIDNIERAESHGNGGHAVMLRRVLLHFIATHR